MTVEKINTDSAGLSAFWDEVKKCYKFEDSDGSSLDFTIVPHSGDPKINGYSGPTIEALIAIAIHRLTGYQNTLPCEENRQALFGLKLALESLEERATRIAQELGARENVSNSVS